MPVTTISPSPWPTSPVALGGDCVCDGPVWPTVVAIIAVASVGFLMLTGRMSWRYGATVILGCFILFGAASIVGGIQASAGGGL